jgi:uncharacterized membrane protein
MRYALAYLASLAAFVVLDAGWLSTMNARLYKPLIGPLLSGRVDILPGVLFYLVYVAGITALATVPAAREGGASRAAVAGAILGFTAYATYDLTNAATLKLWSWKITCADVAWGTFATAVAAAAGCFLLARLKLRA